MSVAFNASVRLPAGAFVLVLAALSSAADADEPSYRTELAVTKAAFYSVDESGRSRRETAPTVAVIGDPDSLSRLRFAVPGARADPARPAIRSRPH